MTDDDRTILQPDDDDPDRTRLTPDPDDGQDAGQDDRPSHGSDTSHDDDRTLADFAPHLLESADRPAADFTIRPSNDPSLLGIDEPTHPRPRNEVGETETLDRIGPYRLVRPIGEGGMGLVYEAEQLEPLRRTVALKIVKRGMDTEEFVARFESEKQALAVMDHPAIARVYDAGATDLGRPYFVMEYVDGIPLNDYCDKHEMSLKDRLKLFIHVCEGVQHAHQKAIIHRDLKPSNVLVTEVDGQPMPKIIDFGVAKAMDRDPTETTLQTGMGQVLGTPSYMAPEQADFDSSDIDTRADVYALGVILYEMLAGERPFPKEELEKAGFKEAMRMIREDDPPKPSDRFSTLAGRRDEVAKFRSVDATSINRTLRGDLDWITMKALEKDRSLRYSTAYGLARDIRRYMNFEPVSAGPPTFRYRMGKFVRRHRAGVITACLVTVALMLGIAGTTVGFIRAVAAEKVATEEARTATRVTDFLVGLFEVSDPDQSQGETITAREVLEQGAERLDTELADEPRVRARLLTTIGKVHRNLGLYEAARPYLESAVQLRRAQDHQDSDLAVSLAELGDLYIQLGLYDSAVAVLEEALTFIDESGDPNQLYLANSLHELANVQRRQGKYDEAEPLYLRARNIRVLVGGDRDPSVASTDNSLAALYWRKGDYVEAERRYLTALSIWEEAYGDNHSDVAKGLNNLALLYLQLKRYEEAEALFHRAIVIYERILGPDHPRLARAVNNLALTYFELERYDEAETNYRRSLAIKEAALGPEHPEVARTVNNLGNVARVRGHFDEAEDLYNRALAIRIAALGDEHPQVAWTYRDLGLLQDERGQPEAGIAYLERAYAVFAAVHGVDHPELAEILDDYAEVLEHAGRPEDAAAARNEADAIRPETADTDD